MRDNRAGLSKYLVAMLLSFLERNATPIEGKLGRAGHPILFEDSRLHLVGLLARMGCAEILLEIVAEGHLRWDRSDARGDLAREPGPKNAAEQPDGEQDDQCAARRPCERGYYQCEAGSARKPDDVGDKQQGDPTDLGRRRLDHRRLAVRSREGLSCEQAPFLVMADLDETAKLDRPVTSGSPPAAEITKRTLWSLPISGISP